MIGDTWGHTGNYLQRGIAHGIVRGILARVQGGNFSRGFMSAFASVQFGRFSQALRDTGNAVKAAFHALVGGTVSLISGGKFGNGAVSAAVVYLFNDMKVAYPKKFLKVSNAGSVKYYMKRYNIGKTDAVALMNWRIEMDRQQMNKAMDVLGLGLSVGSAFSPPGVAIRLGLVALGIDASQPDYGGVATGIAALPSYRGNPRLGIVTSIVDIGYGIWQVAK